MTKTNINADLDFCKRSATCKNYCPYICDEWCDYQPLEDEKPLRVPTPTEEEEAKHREILMFAQLGLFDKSEQEKEAARNALKWADSHPKTKVE